VRIRRLVPEVVQTSAMDCGPASLKAVLEGFGISVSYGRLREACQTEVDGTSIDTLEELAVQLGLDAEQIMIPADHLLLPEARALPALVVVRLPSGITHFEVVWSSHRGLVQVMDPGSGRRWTLAGPLLDELYVHAFPVPTEGWREWAGNRDFLGPLGVRMRRLGTPRQVAEDLLTRATDSPAWLPLASLDASVRMVAALVRARAVRRGHEARRLVERAFERTLEAGVEDQNAATAPYWSVRPVDGTNQEQLLLRGAVLVRFRGRADHASERGATPTDCRPLSPELAAALDEQPLRPGRELLRILGEDGVLKPALLVSALAAAAAAVLVEALLFRGLIDLGGSLGLAHQRAAAIVALLVVLGASALLDLPLAAIALRYGRRLEVRLRMAFLAKIPRLSDRYFHSRLSSDMAERAHTVHSLRQAPGLASDLVRTLFVLAFTAAGIAWLDPGSAAAAAVVAALCVALPAATQRLLVERDLKVRTHAGALTRFYLDAMLGLMPVRCHCAGNAVRREHEALLVEWCRSALGLLRVAVATEGVLGFAGVALAAWLLFGHLRRAGETGMVLLLIYWTLALPALGRQLALILRQYPARRNITLRLFEPLGAPDESAEEAAAAREQGLAEESPGGLAIALHGVTLRAAGHTILENVDLAFPAGSHVAVVGPSGAGKTSLVGVLLGWHKLAAGRVEVDGRVLSGEVLTWLRQHTAWIDPAVQLWNRSLLGNLRFGCKDGASLPVPEVLERAGLYGVVKRMPDGLQTHLGEGGGLVSGGEGQRVRFARGLLRPAVRLAILDEPFRGLQREERRQLLAAARRLWSDVTLLCVTHDVSETLDFDQVVVVEDGRITEHGQPRALLDRSEGRYHQLLEAERQARERLWNDQQWRILHLAEGRLREGRGEA